MKKDLKGKATQDFDDQQELEVAGHEDLRVSLCYSVVCYVYSSKASKRRS